MAFFSMNRKENQVSSILICGNTELLSQACFNVVSHSYQVIVAGNESVGEEDAVKTESSASGKKPARLQKHRNLDIYNTVPGEKKFGQLFDAYSVDVVWYLSGYADSGTGFPDEINRLSSLIHICREKKFRS